MGFKKKKKEVIEDVKTVDTNEGVKEEKKELPQPAKETLAYWQQQYDGVFGVETFQITNSDSVVMSSLMFSMLGELKKIREVLEDIKNDS